MGAKKPWLTKNKWYRIIGAALICCALGLSIGGIVFYSHVSRSLISLNTEHGIVQVVDEKNKISYFQTHYILGLNSSDKYTIDYNSTPEVVNENHFHVNGLFTNETDEHFTIVELNFSLLDGEGNKVGDAYAECDGLNPGQTWNFTAITRSTSETKIDATAVILDDVRITY